MNKENLPLFLSIAVVFGILIGMSFGEDATNFLPISKSASQERKIKRLINFIENEYVDKVSTDNLLDGAITQMLGPTFG